MLYLNIIFNTFVNLIPVKYYREVAQKQPFTL